MRVVGCFVEYAGKFLILKRGDTVHQPGAWCLPAGKIEAGETDLTAIMRELNEEIGYKTTPKEIEFLKIHDIDLDWGHLTFPTFRIKLNHPISVQLNSREHSAYLWVTAKECYEKKDLVSGFWELLEFIGYVKKN
ncbi:NUDIX domain-containing protein [Candidatus Woesearchaeota archaeon]|nr:NUDIX domain-containing protein [Candidatus Woesearchaeota archaeon]